MNLNVAKAEQEDKDKFMEKMLKSKEEEIDFVSDVFDSFW